MHLAFQIFIVTSLVLLCEGFFIPFKRSFSTDPDVSRNVVSRVITQYVLLLTVLSLRLRLRLFVRQNISDLIPERRSYTYLLSQIAQNNWCVCQSAEMFLRGKQMQHCNLTLVGWEVNKLEA